MSVSRRKFLRNAIIVGGVASAARAHASEQHTHPLTAASEPPPATVSPSVPSTEAHRFVRPGLPAIETPDVPKLAWRMEDGVKVFEITAEHVRTEFLPGRAVDAWGFNGSMPGPTIEVDEGDHVRFVVRNALPEPFSMHWHGLEIPNAMDGMPGISQDAIAPGDQFVYEFTLHQNGTFFYHSHMAMQEMMGLLGAFIIHPRRAFSPRVDRDYAILLQEWAILPNNTIPNTLAMEFNWLTMNGKAGPATTPLLCKLGERVRIRLINLGMDHHPIHLHGHQFYVSGTEGGRIRTTAIQPENTVLVGVAQARDIEFIANNEGDWHFHCHLPHHMMNQMASMVGPMMTSTANAFRPGEMTTGMGIVSGSALSQNSGAAFGRALGVGAEGERATPNMGLRSGTAPSFQQPGRTVPNAGMYPGYPQDMFMAMDDMVAKPETYGMRRGWSGGTMGMMTVVRVLRPELFDKIEQLKAEQRAQRSER